MSFLKDAFDFEKLNLKEMWSSIKDDPERLFLGALTPVGSEVWGGITGKDYDPAVNMFGGPSDATWEKAEAQGINTGPARALHDTAEGIAASYAGGYGLDQLGPAGEYIGKASNFGGTGGGGYSSGGPPLSDNEARLRRADLIREMNRGPSMRISVPVLASTNTGTVMASQPTRPPEIEALMRKYGSDAPAGATTYPEGVRTGPGLDVQPEQSPALAPEANGRTNTAPAMAKPNGSRGGAGGTSAQDTIMQASPRIQIDVAEQSANAVSSQSGAFGEQRKKAPAGANPDQPDEVTAQKQQVNEALMAQGVDPKQAFEAMYEQELKTLDDRYESGEITKRQHKGWKNRWKNLFNTVPEEDFGLFMMDFGLRMMAESGQNESFTGSLGVAGHGALQGAVQRKDQKQQMSMQRDQQAFQRALARSGLEKQERYRPAQVESTTRGLIERGPDGEWRPIMDPETGKPFERQYGGVSGADGYQGRDKWLYDFGRRIGKSEEEIFDIINGAMPTQQRRDRYEELILKMIKDAGYVDEDPVLGKKYRDFNAQDIEAWIQKMMGQRRGALQ